MKMKFRAMGLLHPLENPAGSSFQGGFFVRVELRNLSPFSIDVVVRGTAKGGTSGTITHTRRLAPGALGIPVGFTEDLCAPVDWKVEIESSHLLAAVGWLVESNWASGDAPCCPMPGTI